MKITQSNSLEQKLMLNQNMLLSLKILALSNTDIIDMVSAESLENPAINIDISEEHHRKNYVKKNTITGDTDFLSYVADENDNFRDRLVLQTGCIRIPDNIRMISEEIIYSLDEKGYLQNEDRDYFYSRYRREDVNESLNIIKNLYPPGYAAEDLKEFLTINSDDDEILRKIIAEDLNKVATDNVAFLNKKYDIRNASEYIDYIRSLRPYPSYGEDDSEHTVVIEPDAEISINMISGEPSINITIFEPFPEIRVEAEFEKLSEIDSENREYYRSCVDRVRNLNNSLKKRKNTIADVCEVIADRQKKHIIDQDYPIEKLCVQDIADELGLNPSTVSRCIQNKYFLFNSRLIPFRYFIDCGVSEREETSKNYIENLIRRFIEDENPENPVSDNDLTRLMNDRGINIKRRTVREYREKLGFLSSIYRKKRV